MVKARIVGTGSFLPEKILTNKDLEALCDTTDEWIRQRTGIEQRHVAEPGEGTSDLMARAAQRALEDANVDPLEVDAVIACTLTPDYLFPATGCVVQGKIGATNAGAFDVNAACSGFLYGLATGNSFIQTGLCKTVVVVGGELVSNRILYKNRDTGVLFGDGAGAVVLRAHEGEEGVLSMRLGADGANGDMLILPVGGSKTPATVENVEESFTIQMKGQELFKRAVVVFGEVSKQALADAGLGVDDVDIFVPHQANGRIIEASAQRMGLDPAKIVMNIAKVGNTTGGSIPIAFDEARRAGNVKPGDIILFASFGAGVTWGASVIRW